MIVQDIAKNIMHVWHFVPLKRVCMPCCCLLCQHIPCRSASHLHMHGKVFSLNIYSDPCTRSRCIIPVQVWLQTLHLPDFLSYMACMCRAIYPTKQRMAEKSCISLHTADDEYHDRLHCSENTRETGFLVATVHSDHPQF